jgi:hypothetical protein
VSYVGAFVAWLPRLAAVEGHGHEFRLEPHHGHIHGRVLVAALVVSAVATLQFSPLQLLLSVKTEAQQTHRRSEK